MDENGNVWKRFTDSELAQKQQLASMLIDMLENPNDRRKEAAIANLKDERQQIIDEFIRRYGYVPGIKVPVQAIGIFGQQSGARGD